MIQLDRNTVIQILGSLMSKPNLLSDVDKYQLDPTDFSQQLDKFVFSAIYNLYVGGAEIIHTIDIEEYLHENVIARELLEKSNGMQFLQDCEAYAEPNNFNYYYSKLKKINLVRDLQKAGRDTSKIYCEDPFNDKCNEINSNFEQMSATDIINKLKGEVAFLEGKYAINTVVEESNAATGIRDLIQDLKVKPEIGVKLQGDIFNSICRGGRKGRLYLRSASSGMGKSRTMVGDACNIAYPIRYEPKYGKWISTGTPEKVLYVMTEQDPEEIQTMILAYLTGYNEEIFLYGTYKEEHMDRINKAIEIMEKYKDYMLLARIPDPCASVVKNLFRRYSLQYGVDIFFYDYIFSSPAMLNEYRDLALREDVALRLFTTALKNLAIELNAFVMSSTQLSNEDDSKGGFKDFRNIRGSKAIADLADFACIKRRPSSEELKLISGFQKRYNLVPNSIIDIYKNRRGRWTMVSIWQSSNLGTLRTYDLFVTTADIKPIPDFQIIDFVEEKTCEMQQLEDYFNANLNEEVEVVESQEEIESWIDDLNTIVKNDTLTKERLDKMSFSDLL